MERFAKNLKNKVEELLGDGFEVFLQEIIKNNSVKKNAICIRKKGGKESFPMIYLDNLYEKFIDGEDIETLSRIIIELSQTEEQNQDYEMPLSPDKEKIFFQLVNYQENEELLDVVPHKKVEDLAIIYRYMVDTQEDNEMIKSLIINDLVASVWGLDEQELYDIAMLNTPNLIPASIFSLNTKLLALMDSDRKQIERFFREHNKKSFDEQLACCKNEYMLALSSANTVYGAAVMLYPNVLKKVAKLMGEDSLYILPSSIHEVILLPAREDFTPADLLKMVTEVNHISVKSEEVLSNALYIYDANTDEIKKWRGGALYDARVS